MGEDSKFAGFLEPRPERISRSSANCRKEPPDTTMPLLTVIAGPNGSGKSTLTRSVDFEGRDRLVDPDAVARVLNPMNPAAAAIAAGREALGRVAGYLASGVSFAVETTLSGKGNLDLMATAKSRGYEIHLVFVGVDTPERCISRVRYRAARGGHSVPVPM